ncbi:MAG: glycosyltransferase family 2 protein [Pseudobdellovibrio sp.]
MKKDLVSIVTPAYNAEKFIDETINSVINQQYQMWEHLIVIDCNSKDRTKEIVQKYSEKDTRIKMIESPRAKGAAANRNLALELAEGEFIAFLDADDLWTPDKLSKQVTFMQQNNYAFSYTSYRRMNADKSVIGHVQKIPKQVNYNQLLHNNTMACLTVIFRKDAFSHLRFQEYGWEDLSFWLQILKLTPYAYGLNEPLAYYRIVKGSRSNNKLFAARLRWDTFRLVEKLSLVKSIYLFVVYAVTSLFKYRQF